MKIPCHTFWFKVNNNLGRVCITHTVKSIKLTNWHFLKVWSSGIPACTEFTGTIGFTSYSNLATWTKSPKLAGCMGIFLHWKQLSNPINFVARSEENLSVVINNACLIVSLSDVLIAFWEVRYRHQFYKGPATSARDGNAMRTGRTHPTPNSSKLAIKLCTCAYLIMFCMPSDHQWLRRTTRKSAQ